MSVSGRKRVSKWDSKEEEDTEHLSGNDYPEQHSRFYPEGNGRNGSSKRSGLDVDYDDDEHHLKSRQQHPGEAWPPRSRGGGDAAMMSYYDSSRKSSSEQDETRQRQPSRDRPRTRRSGSRSNSRSRSRSPPVQRVRRDAGGGSYDRHKTRSGREVDGRYNRGGEHDWEPKNRKTRDATYYKDDSREQYPSRVGGGRSSDYSSEDNNNNSRRETQRRDVPEREYNRISSVPCRYFASGNCRNGTSCRFSHHGGGPERKPQDEMFSRHDSNQRWNERSDTGKSSEGGKGNNGNWIDDMEMSPDWNYGVKTLKKPLNEEKDSLAPSYEHGSADVISHQQVGDGRSIGMFPTVGEKTVASSHHGFGNNSAPTIQAFNQNQSALPYQNTPLAAGGSQVLPPPPPTAAATHLPQNGNGVSREELNHISNISASLAQLFGNGQPIPNLQSTLNPIQSTQLPQVYGQKEQSSHTQTDILSNNSIHTGVVPAVTALQINNNSDSLVSLAGNPKPSSEEKRREEEAGKEPDGRKTDAEKVMEEEEDEDEDDGAGGENKKKEKDPKGMRAFKFSLVEIVKELLKPAWKEGGMNKDAYKNIVKKVVDKVTGAIQTGNIPQTQEKIDHYLSASKPKLTKLVQAYISKVKKS